MKKIILTILVSLSLVACGGGSEPPDLSAWAEDVAASINWNRADLVYSNVTFTEDYVCGKATNIYDFNDYSYFWYDSTKTIWGQEAVERCKP